MPLAFNHTTVLLKETVDVLGEIHGKTIVDCTLGGGGHTKLILERVGPSGKVIAFDRDLDALAHAREFFKTDLESGRLILVDAPFSELKSKLTALGVFGKVSGVIADIGVSSHQIDSKERGFSFAHDGPLDMRMDPRSGVSAREFINNESEQEIAHVIWSLGEEQKSRQIARLIVETRKAKPFQTTLDLANLISRARLWGSHSKKHPATKTFQALRIHVNDELSELSRLVDDAFDALEILGILAIISFHSLEDRIIKEKYLDFCGKAKRNAIPRDIPFTEEQISALVSKRGNLIAPFPLDPSSEEVDANPRSRSAKLRSIQKTSK